MDDTVPNTICEPRSTGDITDREMRRWMRLLHRLPVVRTERVVAVREALRRNRYDDERILNETIRRLSNDVGILCRR